MDIRNPGYHFKVLLGISKIDRSIRTYISKCQILGEGICTPKDFVSQRPHAAWAAWVFPH
jgi:hypothetical protein